MALHAATRARFEKRLRHPAEYALWADEQERQRQAEQERAEREFEAEMGRAIALGDEFFPDFWSPIEFPLLSDSKAPAAPAIPVTETDKQPVWSLDDWMRFWQWQDEHVRPRAKVHLLVEYKRGYSGSMTEEELACFEPECILPDLTDLPVALLDGEVLDLELVDVSPVVPMEVIDPPPLQAGFDLPVVSPRPGPRVSADCLAA